VVRRQAAIPPKTKPAIWLLKKGGRLIHYRELDEFGFLEILGVQKLDFD